MASASRTHSRWIIPVLVVPAALGVVFVVLSTRWGAGTSPDSAGYVSVARNLLAGHGYRGLHGGYATVWPPLYTYALTVAGALGLDVLVASRWINAALFGVNILLVGFILRYYVRRSWVAILGAVLTASSIDLIRVHSMVWSEPLYTCFALTGLWLLAVYIDRPDRRVLVACAVAVALTAFTRYVGVSLIVAAGLLIVFAPTRRWTRRLVDALLFGAIAAAPLACWLARNALVAGSSSGRTIALHPIQPHHIEAAAAAMSLWLLPEWIPAAVRIAALIVVAAAVIVLAIVLARAPKRDDNAAERPRWPWLAVAMGTFGVAYLVQHVIAISFFDKFLDLQFRQTAPLFPVLTIVALCVLDQLLGRLRRAPRIVLTVLVMLAALWQVNRAAWRVNWYAIDGLGLAGSRWRDSALVQQIKQLDPGVPVFTNSGEIIYFLADRIPEGIPAKYNYRTGEPNADIAAELDAMKTRLEHDNGVIVYFENVPGRRYLTSREELERAMPLRIRRTTPDGVIYEIDR
jgi:hypothetical protein